MAHVFVFCCGVFVGVILGMLCMALLVIGGENYNGRN